MSVSIQGTGSSATTTVTIPTHASGDIIIIAAVRANNTPPTIPAAGGTVPTWNTIHSAGANTWSMSCAYAVATASNHTSGTWTNATQMVAIVLRSSDGSFALGANGPTNANNTQTIVYPAITLQVSNGTSFGVRVGSRGTADSEVANAPSGAQAWTNQVVQPAGASALVAIHTAANLTANPTSDTVNTTGTNAAYRSVTIEVRENHTTQTATPDVATVAQTGEAPAGTATGSASATAGVGTVVQTGVAPSGSGTGTGTATADVATVALSGISPSGAGSGSVTRTPDSGVVALSAADPDASKLILQVFSPQRRRRRG